MIHNYEKKGQLIYEESFATIRAEANLDHFSAEEEIVAALNNLAWQENLVVEGAAALAHAAYLREKSIFSGQVNVVLLCGGNFDRKIILSKIGESP